MANPKLLNSTLYKWFAFSTTFHFFSCRFYPRTCTLQKRVRMPYMNLHDRNPGMLNCFEKNNLKKNRKLLAGTGFSNRDIIQTLSLKSFPLTLKHNNTIHHSKYQ